MRWRRVDNRRHCQRCGEVVIVMVGCRRCGLEICEDCVNGHRGPECRSKPISLQVIDSSDFGPAA
jgi:hypothetical protein